MFKRKYIFETDRTRLVRYLKNSSILFIILFVFYSLFSFVFLYVSNKENQISEAQFYNRSPDLISVFTGHFGRIPYALKKAKEYKQSKIFITGVYARNTVDTLLKPHADNFGIDKNFLEIDYQARNTVENVLSTIRYVRKNIGINKVLIISHDYHIMRIKLLFDNLKNKNTSYKFFYHGIPTDYSKFRNIKILYKEVFKLIRTYGFILFWDPEYPTQPPN